MQKIDFAKVDRLMDSGFSLDNLADDFAEEARRDAGPRHEPEVTAKRDGAELGDVANIQKFLNGGNATFTLRNAKTGNRLTFRVSKPRDKATGKIDHESGTRFVALLSGPDNENSFTYMGMLRNEQAGIRFSLTRASKVNNSSVSYRVFNTFWNYISVEKRMPNGLEFWHSGKCARCGRKLTVPESIESGFGPECIGKM